MNSAERFANLLFLDDPKTSQALCEALNTTFQAFQSEVIAGALGEAEKPSVGVKLAVVFRDDSAFALVVTEDGDAYRLVADNLLDFSHGIAGDPDFPPAVEANLLKMTNSLLLGDLLRRGVPSDSVENMLKAITAGELTPAEAATQLAQELTP